MDGWKVKSNAEAGEGYSDICVEVEDKEIGIRDYPLAAQAGESAQGQGVVMC